MGRVSKKYSVVIPLEVRRAIGLKPGMRVRVVVEGKGARIETDLRAGTPASLDACAGKYRVNRRVSIAGMNPGTPE